MSTASKPRRKDTIPRRPDFFVVGAPRCGTMSIFDFLRQHPQVFASPAKEIHYFGSDLHHVGRPPLRRANTSRTSYERGTSFASARPRRPTSSRSEPRQRSVVHRRRARDHHAAKPRRHDVFARQPLPRDGSRAVADLRGGAGGGKQTATRARPSRRTRAGRRGSSTGGSQRSPRTCSGSSTLLAGSVFT